MRFFPAVILPILFMTDEDAQKLEDAQRLGLNNVDDPNAVVRNVDFYEISNIYPSEDGKSSTVYNSSGRWDCTLTVEEIRELMGCAIRSSFIPIYGS
jgi:hypothetical protein